MSLFDGGGVDDGWFGNGKSPHKWGAIWGRKIGCRRRGQRFQWRRERTPSPVLLRGLRRVTSGHVRKAELMALFLQAAVEVEERGPVALRVARKPCAVRGGSDVYRGEFSCNHLSVWNICGESHPGFAGRVAGCVTVVVVVAGGRPRRRVAGRLRGGGAGCRRCPAARGAVWVASRRRGCPCDAGVADLDDLILAEFVTARLVAIVFVGLSMPSLISLPGDHVLIVVQFCGGIGKDRVGVGEFLLHLAAFAPERRRDPCAAGTSPGQRHRDRSERSARSLRGRRFSAAR